ncbi:MAG: hypothetical protein FJ004_02020 [Chloroflexi bacterium]|nr:hypothetical protein [Chloroflexota bacterium]
MGINPVLIAVVAVFIVALLLFVIYRVSGAQRRQATAAQEEVPVTLLPKTSPGRWSLGLVIAFILLFIVAVVPLGERWGSTENGELINPVLTVVLAILLVGTAVSALVTGFIGVIKHKERSILVLLGMLVAFWFGIVGSIGKFFI